MKRIILISALLGIASVICALLWAHGARNAQRSAAVERQTRAASAAKLTLVNSEVSALRRTLEELRAKLHAETKSGAKTAPKSRPAWKAQDTQAAERDDPRIQLLQAAAQRSRTHGRYAPLYRRLRLSPAQIDKFEDAVANRNEHSSDVWAALRVQGLPLDGPEAQKAHAPIYQDYVAAQTALLGADGFKQLQEYERTLEVRNLSAALAGAAGMRGAALTVDQAEQLTQTLAACAASYVANRGGAIPQDVDWDKASMMSQSFLTQSQYEVVMNFSANGPEGVVGRRLSELHASIEKAVQAKGSTGSSD